MKVVCSVLFVNVEIHKRENQGDVNGLSIQVIRFNNSFYILDLN